MSLNNEIIENIKKNTNHKYVKVTDSGNKAIYAAFFFLKEQGYEQIIIPDQGGWITYKQYCKKLKLDVIELKYFLYLPFKWGQEGAEIKSVNWRLKS